MKMKITITAITTILLSFLAWGQSEAPTPRPQPITEHPTFNRAALWASITARTADTVYTCHNMTTIKTWREQMAPVHTCAGISLWNGLNVGAGFAGQRLMHRMGWHRWESLPHWVSVTGSAVGIAYTLKKRR